ncbi:YhaN family protein [Indioceanicola profundi]|uniref:YhaN family protein n=1 Tax=Indioceanicola profundi TaxID=2220096 RepID=UPI000E6AD508|nr:YhaN family protein [Indioceanicola profundi]
MKFDRLELERFGIFDGHALDLSDGEVRLHVVHAPNEGGKSTALAAICDLLFGIPARTPYNFKHSYDRLRLGAAITNTAGEKLSFKRRKGTANTLLTPDEAALPDSVLARFLGGIDREGFERMFALDHLRLRKGGDAMLAAGGDLARSLFEAGSGLAGLAGIVAGLEKEADAIGALDQRRSAAKPYWAAEGAWTEAQERIRKQALKAEEWAAASGAVQAAEERRQALNGELAALNRRRSKLERIRRIQPILRRLDDAATALAALAAAPDLPDGFEERWRDALQLRHVAAEEVRRASEMLTVLEQAGADLGDPGPWPLLAGEIEALVTDLGDFRTKLADHPKLGRDIALAEERIADQLRELGLEVRSGSVEPMLPARPVIARIREHIQLRARIDAQRESAEKELAEAEEALRSKEQALQALSNPADPAISRAALDQAGDARDLIVRLKQGELRLEEAQRDLALALDQLGRWAGTAQELARVPVPSAALVAEHERQAEARAAERARWIEETDKLAAELRRVESELAGLQAAGTVPTPDAVRAARARRDEAWAGLRRLHAEGLLPNPAQDAEFEAALREADELADRVAVEAKRIADFAKLTAARVQAQADAAEVARRLTDLDRQSAEAKADWQALWSASGVLPGRPGEMRDWLARRDEVLRRLDVAGRAAAWLAEVRAEEEVVRGHLLRAAEALGLDWADGLDTASLRDRVRTAFQAAEQVWTDFRTLRSGAEECRAVVAARRRELETVRAKVAAWMRDWAVDMPLIGLTQQAGPGAAEAALGVWEQIGKTLGDVAQRRHRRDGIAKDLESYRTRLAQLLDRLGPAADGLDRAADPLELVPALARRRAEAHTAATRIEEHARQLARARQTREAAQDKLAAEEAVLAALRSAHDLDSDADVPALARLALERARLAAQAEEARQDLIGHGDGLDDQELRAEVQEIDPDDLAAEMMTLEEDSARLHAALQEAASAVTAAQTELKALEARDGIRGAAQDAANAARTMGQHAATWIRMKAACHILSRAVERYRAANEHPMIRRASALFGLMAGTGDNPVVRLSVDYADADHPVVVGIRRDESHCPVEGMSEGTRDQLYLALRIAAVERAIEAGEPLPFIADDLFITSDERRTEAGLRALADLGRSTQVLLFTHHEYVAEAARRILPAGAVRIHNLAQAEAEPVPA